MIYPFVVADNEKEGLDSWAYLDHEYWGENFPRVKAMLDGLHSATDKAVVSAFLQNGKEKNLLARYCARMEAWISMLSEIEGLHNRSH